MWWITSQFEDAVTPEAWTRTLLGAPTGSPGGRGGGAAGGVEEERFSYIDAGELAQRVAVIARDRARARDVALVIRCACGPIWVQRDGFREALSLLLDNAIVATAAGRPVVLEVREFLTGDVLWQVRDAGTGMSPTALGGLGSPKRRVAPAPPGVVPNSGIARANAIVQRHGGLLHFESAIGVGTTASVWVPLERKTAKITTSSRRVFRDVRASAAP